MPVFASLFVTRPPLLEPLVKSAIDQIPKVESYTEVMGPDGSNTKVAHVYIVGDHSVFASVTFGFCSNVSCSNLILYRIISAYDQSMSMFLEASYRWRQF